MKKKNKHARKHTETVSKELFDQLRDEYLDLADSITRLHTEQEYLNDFIRYHRLEKSYQYFRMNAHKHQDPDLPFGYYTL